MVEQLLIDELEDFVANAQGSYYHVPTAEKCLATVKRHLSAVANDSNEKVTMNLQASIKNHVHTLYHESAEKLAEAIWVEVERHIAASAIIKWQSIDTAPKDGTKIFLLFPGWDYAPIASWVILEGGDKDSNGRIFTWCFGKEGNGWVYGNDEQPIAWMPLYFGGIF